VRRWLYTYQYVPGEPEQLEQRLQAEAGELVRRALGADRHETAVDGSLLVDLPGELAGIDMAKQARVRTGVAHRSGSRLLIPIEWRAEPARLMFPAFEGQLELEQQSSAHVQLSLVGSYRVPLGPVGGLADTAGLHRVAERTVEQVLQGVARELSASASETPGPRFARRWPLRVRDVMTPDPLVLDPQLPLKSAALLLFYAEVSGAPVVAADGSLIGVLSERDLLAKEAPERFGFGRAAADEQRRREATTVADACSRPAAVTVPDARLADAARELLDRDISRLVVIDEGRVVGIVSRHDVLAALVRDDAELYAAVQEALEPLDADDVRAEVTWGEVVLSGTVELRTTHAAAVDAVRGVDGVMSVDAEGLAWQQDDIVPFVPLA
jgi:CBS domain-containing protein